LLAATGSLAKTLRAPTVEQGEVYARDEFRVPSSDTAPDYKRLPSRQTTSGAPMDLLAPVRRN
jgi:hypothetical protein